MSGTAATRVGALGSQHQAIVDPRGFIVPDGAGWELGLWIGADDRWHVPGHEPGTRQQLLGGMPVVETATRVPGGDARARVYGLGGGEGLLAIEVENDSPAPFVVAFVVRPCDPDGTLSSLATHGNWVVVDGRPVLRTAQPARRWAMSQEGATFDVVATGAASTGAFPTTRSRAGTLGAAFLHPLAHRATLRAVVALGVEATGTNAATDPEVIASSTQAVSGWKTHLDRAMHVMVPDDRLQLAIDAARASLLLSATATGRTTPGKLMALEDWGFDAEAAAMWRQLGSRDRRRAGKRHEIHDPWGEIRELLVAASPTFSWADGPAPLLQAVRELVVREQPDGTVALLKYFPREWSGHSVEVHDVPTRRGLVSFAVRWHGPRPALLWECTGAVHMTCPGLDPGWSSSESRGDALLAPSSFGPER